LISARDHGKQTSFPVSPNLLLERKPPSKSKEIRVGNLTFIPPVEGRWAYLAVWMDISSRRIAGWQLHNHIREELVSTVVKKALQQKGIIPTPGGNLRREGTNGKPAAKRFMQGLKTGV
jgi:hypothetical protein